MTAADDAPIEVEHDPVNEQIIIASALLDEDVRDALLPKVSPDLFVDEQHGVIWEAMRAMRAHKLMVDLPGLHSRVSGTVEMSYLKGLLTTYPDPSVNVAAHVSNLRWDKARTDAVGPLNELIRALRDTRSSPDKMRRLGQRLSAAFNVVLDRSYLKDPARLAASHMEVIRQRRNISCYEYGIPALDFWGPGNQALRDGVMVDIAGEPKMVPGAAPGNVTLVTGVSGSGKSVVTARIALEQARRERMVAYGAWEMDPGPTLEMMACMSLGWPRTKVSIGALSEKELRLFRDRMESIGQFVRFFDPPFHDEPGRKYGNEESLEVLYRYIADSGCEVVICDLWERCIPDGSPGPERRALFQQQQIHRETRTHGILVCQQRLKEVEARADKRPTRNTILGSSAWVDIADTILGVHRPGLWKPMQREMETMEISVLKQRYGKWPLAVESDWDGDFMSIENGREITYEHPGVERDELDGLGPKKGKR